MSHNQLISTAGLGDTPTLQVLDISGNHLQSVEDTEKLCILLSLDVSANNILKVIHILVLIASLPYFPFIMLYNTQYDYQKMIESITEDRKLFIQITKKKKKKKKKKKMLIQKTVLHNKQTLNK